MISDKEMAKVPWPFSLLASHAPGPVPARAMEPAAERPAPLGSSRPRCSRTRRASAMVRFFRTTTLARPNPVRSRMLIPRPSISAGAAGKGVRGANILAEKIFGWTLESVMEALARRIDERGRADLRRQVTVAQRIVDANALTEPTRSQLEEPEPDPVSECWRVGDGGDVALIVCRRSRAPHRQEVCAAPQTLSTVEGPDSDQRWPLGVGQARPGCQHAADEILLVGQQASEAEVGRGCRAIQLIAGHVSLFDPQNAQRLGTVWDDAEVPARCHQCADESVAIA